jgi:hypothetical protein
MQLNCRLQVSRHAGSSKRLPKWGCRSAVRYLKTVSNELLNKLLRNGRRETTMPHSDKLGFYTKDSASQVL